MPVMQVGKDWPLVQTREPASASKQRMLGVWVAIASTLLLTQLRIKTIHLAIVISLHSHIANRLPRCVVYSVLADFVYPLLYVIDGLAHAQRTPTSKI